MDRSNGTANSNLVDMTVTLTTTELITITHIQTMTTTERFTAYLTSLPSSSPSDTAGSTSCSSSDTNNTPIYVTVTIVIVGLLITITVVVVGILLCRRYWQGQGKPFSGHTDVLFAKDKVKFSLTKNENEGLG